MLINKSQILSVLPMNSTIGIFGGGQLGRMICFSAHKLGYNTVIFSDSGNCPASFVTDKTIIANYNDQKALSRFIDKIDIATFEFENIPVYAVDFIAQNNKPIYPQSDILRITQNRLNEKDFLRKNNIGVTDYHHIFSLKDLTDALEKVSSKAILKTATMGYDGKGQFTLDKNNDAAQVWQKVCGNQEKSQMILEEFVEFDQEISVIVARNLKKESVCYDPLTNIHKSGILDQSIYPARINNIIAQKAKQTAIKIAEALDLVGIMAVEFFVLKNGDLLVNELAPRPHNSGHFSMDASVTDQFEQLVRILVGMPFGNTGFHSTGYMKNLIGSEVDNIDQYLVNDRAKIHLYGKDKVKEGRKMGHVNILN